LRRFRRLRSEEETKNAERWHFERFDERSKNEMNWNRFFWTRSERETRRMKFLILSRISRKKMIFQRHETNEKRDERISSWARSERKESDWIFLFCIRKEKLMLSVVVNSAWDNELVSTMNEYVDVWWSI
jgi:hypothetical protein